MTGQTLPRVSEEESSNAGPGKISSLNSTKDERIIQEEKSQDASTKKTVVMAALSVSCQGIFLIATGSYLS